MMSRGAPRFCVTAWEAEMGQTKDKGPKNAAAFGRDAYRDMTERLRRYRKAFHVGQLITAEVDRDRLFEVIIHQTNEVMDSLRSTVFLYDERTNQLWSLVGIGLKKREIRIPSDYGVAGWVFQHRVPVTVNDAYSDPRFYPEVDKASGFRTRNIMCVPLINWSGRCIGALQSLNKRSGDFRDDDFELLSFISNYVTIALENMRYVEELKDLNKARERAVNHLSHELKTPLALIGTIFDTLSREEPGADPAKKARMLSRGMRNVRRLVDLQEKIDDILNLRTHEEKNALRLLLTSASDFVEEATETGDERQVESLAMLLKRIDSVYYTDDPHAKKTDLTTLLNEICDQAVVSMGERELEIIRDMEKGQAVSTDATILKKVFSGLLKNAIENTPDEGRIEVTLKATGDAVWVAFRDYGIGITPQNQRLMFQGFFHTQDTLNYSSKRPYQFNAGGAGADLLRTKVFSERCGFSVRLESTRCRFLPHDVDECPGRISECRYVQAKEGCFASGGSTFSILFPIGPSYEGAFSHMPPS